LIAGSVRLFEINRVRRENSRNEEIIQAKTLSDKVKALANHRSQPILDGVEDILDMVETLNCDDW
jgi:hypothetical protein